MAAMEEAGQAAQKPLLFRRVYIVAPSVAQLYKDLATHGEVRDAAPGFVQFHQVAQAYGERPASGRGSTNQTELGEELVEAAPRQFRRWP